MDAKKNVTTIKMILHMVCKNHLVIRSRKCAFAMPTLSITASLPSTNPGEARSRQAETASLRAHCELSRPMHVKSWLQGGVAWRKDDI